MTFENVERTQVPIQIRALLSEAVSLGVIDPTEIVLLSLNHGMDWGSWIRSILEQAKPGPEEDGKSYRTQLAQDRLRKLLDHARSYWDVYPQS